MKLENKKYSFNAPIIISAALLFAIVRRNLSAKYRSGPNSFSPSLGSFGVRVDSPRFECEWHRDYRQRGCCFSQRQRRRQQPEMLWRRWTQRHKINNYESDLILGCPDVIIRRACKIKWWREFRISACNAHRTHIHKRDDVWIWTLTINKPPLKSNVWENCECHERRLLSLYLDH